MVHFLTVIVASFVLLAVGGNIGKYFNLPCCLLLAFVGSPG
jgi:hypothetical protein